MSKKEECIEVSKDIYYEEKKADYHFTDIETQTEYRFCYEIVPNDNNQYTCSLALYTNDTVASELKWETGFVNYPFFMDINGDDYPDMKIIVDEAPSHDILELYVWNKEDCCFGKVIYDDMLAYIEIRDGEIWNWVRSGEGYYLEVLQCKGNRLIKISEEYIAPDE